MNLDISSRLGKKKQEITIAKGKTFEVDCGAETMLKVQEMFKKNEDINALFEIIKILLGKEAEKEIRAMKPTMNELNIITIAIMAQVQEVSYEEMEKRFQNK